MAVCGARKVVIGLDGIRRSWLCIQDDEVHDADEHWNANRNRIWTNDTSFEDKRTGEIGVLAHNYWLGLAKRGDDGVWRRFR